MKIRSLCPEAEFRAALDKHQWKILIRLALIVFPTALGNSVA